MRAKAARAEAHALPFPDGVFAGVRIDRVLQHLLDPEAALMEAVRVTRPEGSVVVAEPDQETLVINVPGVRQGLTDAIKALRRDIGYRNGRLASSLPERFRALGLRNVTVELFPLLITDPDAAFGLPKWVRVWRDEGAFSDDDVREWDTGMDRARNEGLVYAVTFFVISASRL